MESGIRDSQEIIEARLLLSFVLKFRELNFYEVMTSLRSDCFSSFIVLEDFALIEQAYEN